MSALKKAPEGKRAEVLAEASRRTGGQPTAKVVAAVVAERRAVVEVSSPNRPDRVVKYRGQCVEISLVPADSDARAKWVEEREPLLRVEIVLPVDGDVEALLPDARTLRTQLRAALQEFLTQQGWKKPAAAHARAAAGSTKTANQTKTK